MRIILLIMISTWIMTILSFFCPHAKEAFLLSIALSILSQAAYAFSFEFRK